MMIDLNYNFVKSLIFKNNEFYLLRNNSTLRQFISIQKHKNQQDENIKVRGFVIGVFSNCQHYTLLLVKSQSYIIFRQFMQVIQNTSNTEIQQQRQLIFQQQILINALKDQLIRLQSQLNHYERLNIHLNNQVSKLWKQNDCLKEKMSFVKENNQSLLKTVQVYQRQFIKRDYNSLLDKIAFDIKINQNPYFSQVLTTIKSKLINPPLQPVKLIKKSSLSDFYGYFFQQNNLQSEIQLYNCLAEKKKPPKLSKVRSYGKKNFYNENFRHVFWTNIIDNKLNITQKLFKLTQQKLQDTIKCHNSILQQDLRRMDVKLQPQQAKIVLFQIERLLETFEIYRPDIGYIQGMTYFAWMFIIRMERYEAFTCFCNVLICDPFVKSLYTFEEEKIKRIIMFYEQSLMDKKPKLAKHMKSIGVDSDLFIIQWAFTFYTRAFSLRIISKIWDLWFSEGYNVFFKVAITVMQMLEPQILQSQQNDKIIELVRTSTLRLEQEQFIKYLTKQKLSQQLILQ